MKNRSHAMTTNEILERYKFSEYNVVCSINGYIMIYNPVHNSLAKLKSDDINMIFDCNDSGEMEQKLKANGIIVGANEDEIHAYLLFSNKKRSDSSKLTLTIAPTMKCNLHCPYCTENNVERHVMTDDVENHIVKFFALEFDSVNKASINWYGGEPLLEIDRIESLTEKIKSRLKKAEGYSASIITNGVLLTEDMITRLKKLSVYSAQVTLDGSRSLHNKTRFIANPDSGTFDIIAENIKHASESMQIILRINIDYNNLNDIDLLLSQLDKYDLKKNIYVYVARLDNLNGTCLNTCITDKDYDLVLLECLNKISKNGYITSGLPRCKPNICMATTRNSYVVDPRGNLYKCLNTIGNLDEKIGDVFNGIQVGDNLTKWLNYTVDSKCEKCRHLPMCGGGCPLKRLKNVAEDFECSRDSQYYEKAFDIMIKNYNYYINR